MRNWFFLLASALVGCRDADVKPPRATPEASWRVDAVPILSLGATDSDTTHEFSNVSGAVRLANGEIVVSDNGSRQLRWFSSAGMRRGTSGRRGAGPGEFGGRINVARYRRDTLVVWDANRHRWSVFDSAHRYVRLLDPTTNADFPGVSMARIVNRSLVFGVYAAVGVPPWVDGAVDSLRRAGSLGAHFREGMLDDVGLLWLRAPGDSTRWDVIAPNATMLGSVVLPHAFEPYQIATSEVLGKFTDADGFEFVRAYRLQRPIAAHGAPEPLASAPQAIRDTTSGWDRETKQAARSLIVIQEAFYADHMAYATDPKKLPMDDLRGVRVEIFGGDQYSWRGAVIDNRTGASCVIIVGDTRWPIFETACFR